MYLPSGALFLGGEQNQGKLDLSSLVEWENVEHRHQMVVERQKRPHKSSVGPQIFNLPSFYWRGQISFMQQIFSEYLY